MAFSHEKKTHVGVEAFLINAVHWEFYTGQKTTKIFIIQLFKDIILKFSQL